MTDDTYEIPSINFYVIQPNPSYFQKEEYKDEAGYLDFLVEYNKQTRRVNYNDFTGKSLYQISLYNYSETGYIVVAAIIWGETYSFENSNKKEEGYRIKTYLVNVDSFPNDCLLDDAVASMMLKEYESYNDDEKRIVHCFLERFFYKTKEATAAKLKELLGIEPPRNDDGLRKLLQKLPKDTDK